MTDASIHTKETGAPRLSLAEHLQELRGRLGICLVAVVLAAGVGFWRAEWLIRWLKQPAGALLPRLAFFSPTEALVACCKVALAFGVVVALPVLLYQLWAFVQPALTWRERYYGLAFVWWGSLLFALGATFAYWVCLPMFLRFLLTIGSPSLEPVISISRYLGFVTEVMLVCGLLFELPLVVILLTRLGVVTPATLRRRRGWALLILVSVAAVITPTTDALSLILVTIPLLLLYELSILAARWVVRPPRDAVSQSVRH